MGVAKLEGRQLWTELLPILKKYEIWIKNVNQVLYYTQLIDRVSYILQLKIILSISLTYI